MSAGKPAMRVIELAQYLSGLTVAQDAWGEASRAIVSLLDADWCAVGGRDDSGAIRILAWAFADPAFAAAWLLTPTATETAAEPGPELRQCIAETLDSGFLGFFHRADPAPDTVICLPITQESRVTAALAVGHRGAKPPSSELLNVYLAVAGMVGTAATRLASERELREHRRHLAALVEERTTALRAINRQLQREVRERRCNEEILAARLRLIALAPSHELAELLRVTLDEVERLTDSTIGFYHFIGSDQRTISLQTWSTKTIQNHCQCQAETGGQHHPLEQAGIWADCVRLARPIIHNDYASLPHRKGLPPGHATIVRQLTVPVLREGRAVAILGVGNKPRNYTIRDLGAVAALADLAWDIFEGKRLQDLLRRQATTDELTGLANRRVFMERAEQELARSKRYGYACSIAVIDLDHFKQINDDAGHAAGDRALVTLARHGRASLRESDLFARVGGDEFALLLPQTGAAPAREVVERLRGALAACPGEHPGAAPSLKLSVGIASFPDVAGSLDTLLRCADQALYCAKAAGRDRVCIAPPVAGDGDGR